MQAVLVQNNKKSKISKQTHIVEHIGENGDIQYNCTACRKVFCSRSQRYYHINCNQLKDLVFKCEHCDKSFSRRTQWKYHIESHTSPVNICHKCQKTFSNPLALKKHIALHEVEPKVCPHCDKTFKKKISLDDHIAAQHLHNHQYGCAYCNKKYASKSTLQLHLQTHEKKRFECSFCGKLFQRNSILKLHLKRHNNPNSYLCTICQKTFSESGALARHKKIHEDSGLQYFCSICDKRISRKDNMARHLTTIHPEEKFDDIVRIIRPTLLQHSRKKTVETGVFNFYNSNQDNFVKSDNNFLIIENKVLNEPFEKEQSTKEPKNNTSSVEHPIVNQTKVITAIPTYKSETFLQNTENMSQEVTSYHQQGCSIFKNPETMHTTPMRLDEKYELIKTGNKFDPKSDIVTESHSLVHSKLNQQAGLFEEQDQLGKNEEYFHTFESELKTCESFHVNHQHKLENKSTVTQAFSSVIRSVGNVKKALTPNALIPIKSVNQNLIEYKHKKYCRNNYNIDLYRKILGCDELDEDENIEKQEKCDHLLKSSTPVHWRKCFKNNYETSGS